MPKRVQGVAQVIDHLPSKHKTLSSNPSTDKKNKESFLALENHYLNN
jgi:hypothetical protein